MMTGDARAMLRAARDARKIQHPYASYTGDNLSCTVCGLFIKVETQWESHVRSAQHVERLKKTKLADPGLPSRKRKAEDTSPQKNEIKRSRIASAESEPEPQMKTAIQQSDQLSHQQGKDERTGEATPDVEEEEWAAFERDLEKIEGDKVLQALSHPAISAAPVSAEMLAAQAREAQSQQRGAREEELEAEDEEAATRTTEEVEEMERLRGRMQQLREKRTALRRMAPVANVSPQEEDPKGSAGSEAVTSDESDDEATQDEDDWANFGLRQT